MEKEVLFKELQTGLKNWIISMTIFIIAIPINIFLLYKMLQAKEPENYILLGTMIFVIAVCL